MSLHNVTQFNFILIIKYAIMPFKHQYMHQLKIKYNKATILSHAVVLEFVTVQWKAYWKESPSACTCHSSFACGEDDNDNRRNCYNRYHV